MSRPGALDHGGPNWGCVVVILAALVFWLGLFALVSFTCL